MSTIQGSTTPRAIQTMQWALNPIGYMETNRRRYGDFFTAPISPLSDDSFVFVNHPEALQYILTHDSTPELSAPGEPNRIVEPLLGSRSLILLSGADHRRHRKLVMPPFHGERLKVYGELICNITKEVAATWQPGVSFVARQSMQTITMRVILQAVFGLAQGERYEQLQVSLTQRLDMVSSPLASLLLFFPFLQKDLGTWSPGHRVQQVSGECDRIIYDEIRERRTQDNSHRTDVLSLLLAARDDQGEGLDDVSLRDELMTLLVAGHETTATALTWALYWIYSRPDIYQRLMEELKSCDASDPLAMTRLPYLNAVCNETLRIYPVAMLTFPRQADQDFELQGHPIAAGTYLMGCIYLIHQHPEVYQHPQEFNPDRFLEKTYSPYEFIPFGNGVRRCVGSALAQMELNLVLATILLTRSLEFVGKQPVRPQRRGLTLGSSPVMLQCSGYGAIG
ncbi:cytochrome P450 [Leptothoe sp. PORK10 BA2]|uniref:cytochrome P450 n=1 Tax=Leptothoe sp. PORK10 BA2 TaxID=3110254 RepID=UPI002B2198CA|nr:cytochrome P450 [Leptothoe sp. PORK10 BA2]MEA5467175.1 cytochrome P450 [Leptothoe sp. PORK10 BA2]